MAVTENSPFNEFTSSNHEGFYGHGPSPALRSFPRPALCPAELGAGRRSAEKGKRGHVIGLSSFPRETSSAAFEAVPPTPGGHWQLSGAGVCFAE